MAGESRARIETTAADLLADVGYSGFGLKTLSTKAGLPYGSIYHHFPGGKDEIAATAISQTGDLLEQVFVSLFEDGVTSSSLRQLFAFMADRLEQGDWLSGCPVGTPTLDGSALSSTVRDACNAGLRAMIRPLELALVRQGLSETEAHSYATTVVAAYEGATLLARAQRSIEPLTIAGEAMGRLLEAFSD